MEKENDYIICYVKREDIKDDISKGVTGRVPSYELQPITCTEQDLQILITMLDIKFKDKIFYYEYNQKQK